MDRLCPHSDRCVMQAGGAVERSAGVGGEARFHWCLKNCSSS